MLDVLKVCTFVLKNKSRVINIAAAVLSHQAHLLSLVSIKVIGFDELSETYINCLHFVYIVSTLKEGPSIELSGYILYAGYIFQGSH